MLAVLRGTLCLSPGGRARMKLTLAMGLQYYNGRSRSLYALTIGQGQGKPELREEASMPVHAIAQSQVSAMVLVGKDALNIFTYDLRGFPAPVMQESASINLFV